MSDDPNLVSSVQRATALLAELDADNWRAWEGMTPQLVRDLLLQVADQAQTIERLQAIGVEVAAKLSFVCSRDTTNTEQAARAALVARADAAEQALAVSEHQSRTYHDLWGDAERRAGAHYPGQLEAAEQAAAALRAQRDELLELARVVLQSTREDAKGEQWTIRAFLEQRGVFNEDMQGSRRLVAEACKNSLARFAPPAPPAEAPVVDSDASPRRVPNDPGDPASGDASKNCAPSAEVPAVQAKP